LAGTATTIDFTLHHSEGIDLAGWSSCAVRPTRNSPGFIPTMSVESVTQIDKPKNTYAY
jgi:hypothetical protein